MVIIVIYLHVRSLTTKRASEILSIDKMLIAITKRLYNTGFDFAGTKPRSRKSGLHVNHKNLIVALETNSEPNPHPSTPYHNHKLNPNPIPYLK